MALAIVVTSLLLVASVNAQTLRDPTLPGQGYAVVSQPQNMTQQSLVLNSIVNGQNAYAVINNKIVAVGDTVNDGLTVSSIGQDNVTLSDGRKLQLFQSITER
ncbi:MULTISPECIES: SctD/MshK family protein [Shewanella]|uniref:MSHA biogenesis protein MshK n=1 Tax=Shewanella metallivivens TaxID=2872342 RepID=A0ABT5TNS6_9GAMM|nr:MSHA biogenesis protein MshK [Shewanella metallivivens]MDD8060261.1 MSHA biogenesis protein MshK [Shewanella metallivivens]